MPESLTDLMARIGGSEEVMLAALREAPREWLPYGDLTRVEFRRLWTRMEVASGYPWVYEVRWTPGAPEGTSMPVQARAVQRKVRVPETMPAKTGSRTWEMDPERYFRGDLHPPALAGTEHDPTLAPTLGFEDE